MSANVLLPLRWSDEPPRYEEPSSAALQTELDTAAARQLLVAQGLGQESVAAIYNATADRDIGFYALHQLNFRDN